MAKHRVISLLSLGATFFAFGVIALGAFTRLIDAGLGCPDWPGCYGHLIVPGHVATNILYSTPFVAYKAWAEMIHRYFAGTLGLLIAAIFVLIFFKKENLTRNNLILASGLILLVVYQILLGQWTVTLKLLPIVVTQHLLGGFGILTLLWLTYLINTPRSHFLSQKGTMKKDVFLFPWALFGCFLLFLQISLGAWTSTNYASLSCPDFPFCVNAHPSTEFDFKEAFRFFSPVGLNYEGGVLSNLARQTIHMMHRLGALVVSLYLFGMMIAASLAKISLKLMKSVYVVLGLLVTQICIGIANILFKLPLVTAISHNLVAVLLLLAMITWTYQLASMRKRMAE